ncbi:MAG: metallophosphoesterase [Clostridia bacterium]|nr:metallophosphoesterase [Clostridia bacterium]
MKKRFSFGQKRLLRAAAMLIAALWMSAVSAMADTKLMVVSDLHYLEPSLYRGSDYFLRALRRGDGKATQYGEELMAALYQTVLFERPDALIVTGDLTFNGEQLSHRALAEWFKSVEKEGIPVWVIPGNHDINIADPLGYGEGMVYRVDGTPPEVFAEVYADYLDTGDAGFSYVAKVSSDMWVAMTDVAIYRDVAVTPGLFSSRHAAWLEGVLKEAREEGVRVVTATHHGLLEHTELYRDSFVMYGSESMGALCGTYGVKLNLSGHLHIQHIAHRDGLNDAALGAFCMWPHRYAVVTLGEDGKLVYDAKALDLRFLPEGFADRSREWFAGITEDKARGGLSGTDEEIEMMAEYAARFNLAYFSGTYIKDDPSWTEDPAYALLKSQGNTPFIAYMALVMNEDPGDNLHLEIGE